LPVRVDAGLIDELAPSCASPPGRRSSPAEIDLVPPRVSKVGKIECGDAWINVEVLYDWIHKVVLEQATLPVITKTGGLRARRQRKEFATFQFCSRQILAVEMIPDHLGD
jgi:hypothetical protein